MNAKAGEHRRSEPCGLDVTISARYDWSVARIFDLLSTTSFESQESYLLRSNLRSAGSLVIIRLPSLIPVISQPKTNPRFQANINTIVILIGLKND